MPAGWSRPWRRAWRRAAPDLVVAPALGGIVLGYELGRQLGCTLDLRRAGGRQLHAAARLRDPAGSRIVVAEDVITTGLSTRECIACCAAAGGEVVAVACLVDRSAGKAELGVPLHCLATLDLPTYAQHKVPPELAAIPAVKPGSRGLDARGGSRAAPRRSSSAIERRAASANRDHLASAITGCRSMSRS